VEIRQKARAAAALNSTLDIYGFGAVFTQKQRYEQRWRQRQQQQKQEEEEEEEVLRRRRRRRTAATAWTDASTLGGQNIANQFIGTKVKKLLGPCSSTRCKLNWFPA
jgi:hypothetical protein